MNDNQELQELMNISVQHVRRQGRPSTNGKACVYRSDSGLQCAAAPFITDYIPEMDTGDYNFSALIQNYPHRVSPISFRHAEFVKTVLQRAHDEASRYDDFMDQFHRELGIRLDYFNRGNGTSVVIPPAAAMGVRTY